MSPKRLAVILALAVAAAGCSATDMDRRGRWLADRLEEEAHATGIAPELDEDIALSLYGDDAEVVCGPLEGDPNALVWSRMRLEGMPEEVTDDLVAYDRLVVEVYCPDRLDTYDDLLDRLNYDD